MSVSVRPPSVDPARLGASSGRRLAVAAGAGLTAIVVTAVVGRWWQIPVVGWIAFALAYIVWVWRTISRFDATETALHARREDPGRQATALVLLNASLVSLLAIGLVLVRAANTHGLDKGLLVGSCVTSVVLAWAVVHTVFTLRYADLYYQGEPGGIDFNGDEPPDYLDFAYLAWTLGMTFQVSDTDLRSRPIRRTALRHAMLSYAFGTLIIATTINLIAGLGK
jgi:uncharacterized membrane protein